MQGFPLRGSSAAGGDELERQILISDIRLQMFKLHILLKLSGSLV